MEFFRQLFDAAQFLPHGHCYLWKPEILWLQVVSNVLIAVAYYSIPLALLAFVARRKDAHFPFIFRLFGVFIASCGTTHLINTWTIWHPVYRLEAASLAFTALVSVFTSIATWKLLPAALALPSASELAEKQKLESIGRLAAGIAREIDSPARSTGANLALLERSFMDACSALERCRREGREATQDHTLELFESTIPLALAQSREAIARVEQIAGAMKMLAHPGGEAREAIDLNLALDATLTMSSALWRDVADLETSFGPGLEAVICLPGEINQAVLNVVVNAGQAIADMHASSGASGHIRVTTLRVGESAVIEITDDGPGIPEPVRGLLFDPFFSTRPQGRGQGLPMARAVIDRHGGRLDVDSEVGKGTTVRIEIPIRQLVVAKS